MSKANRKRGTTPSQRQRQLVAWVAAARGAMQIIGELLRAIGLMALAPCQTDEEVVAKIASIRKLCGDERATVRLVKGALGPAPRPDVDIEAEYLFKAVDDALATIEDGDLTEGARLVKEAARQLRLLEQATERALR